MKIEEYKEALKALHAAFDKQKMDLAISYAKANNPYEIGDVVQDHMGMLEIKSISLYISAYGTPMCIYKGIELKKDKTPAKRQTGREVYQDNLITAQEVNERL